MRKVLICALALGGFAASAQAADLSVDSLKDPLPDTITYHGVTIYGTIDVGYAYAEHSTAVSQSIYVGVPLTMWGQKPGNGSISSLTENGLSQSKVGLKVEESIGMGFTAIGKIESDFNPLSGEIADACASMVENIAKPITQQNTNGAGSRCGQAFGDQAWAGVSSSTFGTLTIGRQYSLENEAVGKYDPMGQSYALSNLGYTATTTAGAGTTELSRWDNSVKYVFQYGPAHVAGMYSDGGEGTAIFGEAGGANAGITWKGLSVDAVYQRENGAANLADGATLVAGGALKGTVTDGEEWSAMAKYTMDAPALFGAYGGGFKDSCGLKDECPAAKLTFMGGYAHVELTNYGGTLSAYDTTIGGYAPGNYGGTWNTNPYATGTGKVLESEWGGAKYETGAWTLAAAYYHTSQEAYIDSAHGNCAAYTAYNTTGAGKGTVSPNNLQGGSCSGDFNQVSFLVDYTFTKHFDVYAGASWSNISGGLSSGYLQNENAGVITGMRLKF
ncbi:MAG: porin [Rhodomicrobium sp.]